MVDVLERLTKLVHRLGDDNLAEAEAAFRFLRQFCQSHQIKISDYHLAADQSGGQLDRYLAALDRMRAKDPQLIELEKTNRKLQAALARRCRRRKRANGTPTQQQEMLHG